MGSMTRMSRGERFRKNLEDKIVSKSPFQMGDWVEVVGVSVGLSEDGFEVMKLYVTFRNKRTGDEDTLTFDEHLYAPEDMDENNVGRLHDHLFRDQGYEEEEKHDKNMQETIDLLKKAELINPDYKLKLEAP